MFLGVLFFLNRFSCCISFLSSSVSSSFEVNVWLVSELILDGTLPCLCCSFLGFCASKFLRIGCGSFAILVLLALREMMWSLLFTLFAPDTAFADDFLNAVRSLVGFTVSSLVVSGLYC